MNLNSDLLWRRTYNIDIPIIDLEHKIFLNLINSVKKAIDNGQSKEELERIVIEIEKYARFHFCSEENIMLSINYPDINSHQLAHYNLLEELNVVKHKKSDFMAFYEFLLEWFICHTTIEDMAIKAFVEENKVDITSFTYDMV